MSTDQRDDPQPKELIYDARRQMQVARNQYWSEAAAGAAVSEQTHLQLAQSLVMYWDVLHEHRHSSAISNWPDIADVRDRLGRQVRKQTTAAGRGRGMSTTTMPAVLDIPAERLIELSKDLDDVAKELKFAAPSPQADDIFAVKRDPDDYEDPVNDDIPKPQ